MKSLKEKNRQFEEACSKDDELEIAKECDKIIQELGEKQFVLSDSMLKKMKERIITLDEQEIEISGR